MNEVAKTATRSLSLIGAFILLVGAIEFRMSWLGTILAAISLILVLFSIKSVETTNKNT